MPIARYYVADPRVTGMADFLAGFGRSRQQMQLIDYEQQANANRTIGQNIGQGIGNMFNVPAQDYMDSRQSQRQLQNQLALQREARVGQAEAQRQRDQGDVYQDMVRAELARYGQLTPTDAAGLAAMPQPGMTPELQRYEQGAVGTGAPTLAGRQSGPPSISQPPIQPPNAPQEGLPLPSINPGMTAQYRQAEEQVQQLSMARNRMWADPNRPMEEKVAADKILIPQIARWSQLKQRYPQPKPPTSEQELIQGGVVIPSENGGSWYQSGPGKWSFANPPKTQPDSVSIPKTPEEAQQYVTNREGTLKDGTRVLIQPDGKLTPVKTGSDSDDDIDYAKEYETSRKALTTLSVPNPEPKAIKEDVAQRQKTVAEMEHDAKAAPLARQAVVLFQDVREGRLNREEADKWAAGIIRIYGPDKRIWPEGVRAQFDNLSREINGGP